MPAFKYISHEKPTGRGGRATPQARALKAPQLRAPIQQTVTMGHTVKQRPVFQASNQAAETAAESLSYLGNLLFKRSMEQADRQSTIDAENAIQGYRRAVSDAYYSPDGLWSLKGRAGSRVYQEYAGSIDKLRDHYADGLSSVAKQKYLLKVQGYHNTYLDQLARRELANVNEYQGEVLAMNEGNDAGDIYAMLGEGNDRSVREIIASDPDGLTDVEKQARRDRLVISAISSADARNITAAEMRKLFGRIGDLASQNVQNKIMEGIDTYEEAEEAAREKLISDSKKARKEAADKNFRVLLEEIVVNRNQEVEPKHVLQAGLGKEDTKYLLNGIKHNKETSEQDVYDYFLVQASEGMYDKELAKKMVGDGRLAVKDYISLDDENDAEIKRKSFPEKESGAAKAAFEYLGQKKTDGTLTPLQTSKWKRALRHYIEMNPDKDPSVWIEQMIEPEVQSNQATRFLKSFWGTPEGPAREDKMLKYQHFTEPQMHAYNELKQKMLKAGKGNLDTLPEDRVEELVNQYMDAEE